MGWFWDVLGRETIPLYILSGQPRQEERTLIETGVHMVHKKKKKTLY